MPPKPAFVAGSAAVVGVYGFVAMLWALGLPAHRIKPDLTQRIPPPWQRGQPSAAGCEIVTQADGVRITIPGLPLKCFESGGLGHLPATESPFVGHSSVSLRLRQAGIDKRSQDIGGGETNRPYTEGGIHMTDNAGTTTFYLYHRATFYHELKQLKREVAVTRRTADFSYTSRIAVEPSGDFIDLRLQIVGGGLQAWFSTTEPPKWVRLKTFELRERPTTYGVCAFSNADTKTEFDFTSATLTPER